YRGKRSRPVSSPRSAKSLRNQTALRANRRRRSKRSSRACWTNSIRPIAWWIRASSKRTPRFQFGNIWNPSPSNWAIKLPFADSFVFRLAKAHLLLKGGKGCEQQEGPEVGRAVPSAPQD